MQWHKTYSTCTLENTIVCEPSIRLHVTVINQLNDPNDNDQCITTQAGQTIALNDQGIKKSFILLMKEDIHVSKTSDDI